MTALAVTTRAFQLLLFLLACLTSLAARTGVSEPSMVEADTADSSYANRLMASIDCTTQRCIPKASARRYADLIAHKAAAAVG